MQQRHTAGQAPEPSTRETVVRGGVFTPTEETVGVKWRSNVAFTSGKGGWPQSQDDKLFKGRGQVGTHS